MRKSKMPTIVPANLLPSESSNMTVTTASAAPLVSLFSSRITNRRFDDETVRILEAVVVSRDVKSLMEARSTLSEFMRSETLSIIREISEKTVEQKLSVIEFLVRAFALVGDVESCLALKYEGLLLRDLKSASHQWLRVSCTEWLSFAEDLLDNGYYSVARQACEKALLCLQKHDDADAKADELLERTQILEKIKRLRDHAVKLTASGSVQAQAAEYLQKKAVEKSKMYSSFCPETKYMASTMFRIGIKKRNARKLHEHQSLKQNIDF